MKTPLKKINWKLLYWKNERRIRNVTITISIGIGIDIDFKFGCFILRFITPYSSMYSSHIWWWVCLVFICGMFLFSKRYLLTHHFELFEFFFTGFYAQQKMWINTYGDERILWVGQMKASKCFLRARVRMLWSFLEILMLCFVWPLSKLSI